MTSNNLNGEPIVILTLREAVYVKAFLEGNNELKSQIIKKCEEAVLYNIELDNN